MMLTAATLSLVLTGAGHSAALIESWDTSLCETAQLRIAGAGADDFPIEVLYGESNGFHVIQMDTDAESGTVTIATSAMRGRAGDATITTAVACKMVDADRIRDVLGIRLKGKQNTCRDVNQETYLQALNSLTLAQRRRFLADGIPLRFLQDYVTASGGEWLPSKVETFVQPQLGPDGRIAELQVTAPAVRVPWNPDERAFFQGTRHCKLLSAALIRHWMLAGSFAAEPALFSADEAACEAPGDSSVAGSCRFWFAPAESYFCQDYTGTDWTRSSVRDECARRHASPEALAAADSRYEGKGGVYSRKSCAERTDSAPLRGACVFHCNAGDESVWRQSGDEPGAAAGTAMMTRACDLYIE